MMLLHKNTIIVIEHFKLHTCVWYKASHFDNLNVFMAL